MSVSPVDVWMTRPGLACEPESIARAYAWLSEDERQRWRGLQSGARRHEFLLGRALLRTVLSRIRGGAPESWTFVVAGSGRPELHPAQNRDDLRFNLSHTDGLVVCAVTYRRRIGIDVECSTREVPAIALARRFFAPAEAAAIATSPPGQRSRLFHRYWTLKESLVKARGERLETVQNVSFGIEDGEIRLLGPQPDRWRFWAWDPTARHTLAIATEVANGEEPTIRVHAIETVGAA